MKNYFIIRNAFILLCVISTNILFAQTDFRQAPALDFVNLNPSFSLQFYNYNAPQIYLNSSQNIASPVQVASSTIGFRIINNVNGPISNLNVVVSEVSNNGIFVQNIINESKSINAFQNLTYVNLNSFCIDSLIWGFNPGFGNCNSGNSSFHGYFNSSYHGYFSYSNAQNVFGKYYKIITTITTPSGLHSSCSYLFVNSIGNKMVSNSNVGIDQTYYSNFKFYPNPVSNLATIEFDLNVLNSTVSLEVFNMLGVKVESIITSQTLSFNQSLTWDSSKLKRGNYIIKLNVNGKLEYYRFIAN